MTAATVKPCGLTDEQAKEKTRLETLLADLTGKLQAIAQERQERKAWEANEHGRCCSEAVALVDGVKYTQPKAPRLMAQIEHDSAVWHEAARITRNRLEVLSRAAKGKPAK